MNAERFDVVIVGGGAAGCVLARRLAEPDDRSVLLLEAGPDIRGAISAAMRDGWNNPSGSDWEHDWGFESEPDASGATNTLRRGRLLGGTSWLTRFAVRGATDDYESWAARGNPGWRYEDVLPAFRRLETDTEFGDLPLHGDRGPLNVTRYPRLSRSPIHAATLEAFAAAGFPFVDDHNAPGAIGAGPMPMSTRDGLRITALGAYLPAEVSLPRLEIRPDTMAARVAVRGGRAVGVELTDGTQIDAGQVILSAGTYGSPALLMRSGIGPAAHLRDVGVPVVVDLPGVGENLADHPATDFDTGWNGAATSGRPVLHSIATWRSASQPADAAPDLMFWATDPAGEGAAYYLDPILLKPEARGTVRLRSADPSAAPRITVPSPTARDVERLVEGYRRALEISNRRGMNRLGTNPPSAPSSDRELRDRVVSGAYSIPHVVGTCRMGPSPGDGDVVDALGRVHGVAGLSVIDASIIPDAPSGFPHVITIMLAERLAELASLDA